MGARMNREMLTVAVRTDLTRVAGRTGAPKGSAPALMAYREHGRYGTTKVRIVAGGRTVVGDRVEPRVSWSEAVRLLGFEPLHEATATDTFDIARDVRDVARRVGRGPGEMPSVAEYREHGAYSYVTVTQRLAPGDRSWHSVAAFLDLQPVQTVRHGSLSRERMVRDYRRTAEALGYESGGPGPSRREFDRHADYASRNAGHYFDGWNDLARAAGFEPRPVPEALRAQTTERRAA